MKCSSFLFGEHLPYFEQFTSVCLLLMLFSLHPLTFVFFKYIYPVVEVGGTGEENTSCKFSSDSFHNWCPSCCRWSAADNLLSSSSSSPHNLPFLYLYSLEIYPGIYCIQLAVQGVEGGSLGGLGSPAIHHDAINILRTACWAGQPKPRRQQVQHFLVTFS